MASTSAAIEGDLRRLFDVGAVTGLTDKELLERFLRRDSGSSAAFEAILTRHGPVVWSACNQYSPTAWSEDVFQATFLILIRRAGALRLSGSLGPWLVEVARRTALKAGTAERRRRVREGRVAVPQSAGSPAILPDESAPQVRAEVARLPAKYRQPVHLCYFEGKTHDEAAIALDRPVGTIRGRLARARQMLRSRLARRGIAPAEWLATMGVTEARAEVPASLRAATLAAASNGAPAAAGIVMLADLVIRGLALAKATLAVGLAIVLISAGAGFTAWVTRSDSGPQPAQATKLAAGQPPKVENPHTDRYGDPLPRGALNRLGTARFRQNEFDDGHAVSRLFYTPDGRNVVNVGSENAVTIWDARTGRALNRIVAQNAVLSPDGRALATTGPGVVQLREFPAGRELRKSGTRDQESYRNLAFSPDSTVLAAIGVKRGTNAHETPTTALVAWNAATLEERFREPGPEDFLFSRSLVFSPDGRTIAVASPYRKFNPNAFFGLVEPERSSIRLFDAANGQPLRRIYIPHFDIGSLAYSPYGQTLAAGVGDRTLRRYDPSTGSERLPRLGRDQAEPLPKDGDQVRKWYEDAARSASALAFSPDGSLLVSGQESIGWLNGRVDESFLSIWDIATGRQVHRFFGHYGGTSAVVFAPDGKTFASAGGETVVRTWDPASGRESEPRPGHKGQYAKLAISPADGTVFTGGDLDRIILRWDPTTGNCLGTVAEGLSGVLALDVAPDGKSMLIDTWDGLMLWDIAKGREVRRFSGKRPAHTGFYRAEFSPDGRSVTMGLEVWETATGRKLASFAHRDPDGMTRSLYRTARFAPNGKRLIAFDENGVGVLDIAAGKETGRPIRAELNNAWLSVVSPDGRLAATGNFVPFQPVNPGDPRQRKADLTVRVYELASGRQVVALMGHTDEITGLAFSPDSRMIATAAGNFWHRKDRSVRVWDAATGRELRVFDNPDGADSVAYLPDGRRVVTVGMDGVATVWDVSVP
jgi:RNA polymerase sigma factor (sigma-70 family)